MIYMQARFYLPMYGRFASPDPARDQHFEETQSWNIYSYVRNNLIMNTDPTGMWLPDKHKQITFNAHKNSTIHPKYINEMARGAVDWDSEKKNPGSQDPRNSPWHSMRSKGESIESAIYFRDMEVYRLINKAIESRASGYLNNNTGDILESYYLSGKAQHIMQDEPVHQFKEWNGYGFLWLSGAKHFLTCDFNQGLLLEGLAAQASRDIEARIESETVNVIVDKLIMFQDEKD